MKRIFRKPNFSLIRRKKSESVVDGRPTPSTLEKLPLEVKRHIASFLPIPDLLKLSETSKRANRDLDVVVVSSPLTDRASQNKTFQTSGTLQCFALVIPNQEEESESHPTTFAFDVAAISRFTDGTIWVIEQKLSANQTPDVLRKHPFGLGKTVAEFTVTSIIGRKIVYLSFFPKRGKFYQFWVANETEIQLNNMMLHCAAFGMKPSSSHVTYQFEVRRPRIRMCAK